MKFFLLFERLNNSFKAINSSIQKELASFEESIFENCIQRALKIAGSVR